MASGEQSDLDWAAEEMRVPVEDLDIEVFRERRTLLHKKYHPDRFGYLNDADLNRFLHEVYLEVNQRLARVEATLLRTGIHLPEGHVARGKSLSATDLKIEFVTQDKDLKYRLFRRRYTALDEGTRIPVPGTNAYITATTTHSGRDIGFQESLKLYLTYQETDSVKDIVVWLYMGIQGHVMSLWIDGERVEVDPDAIYRAIARRSLLH